MQRDELVQRICAGYCSFYKPGKTDEIACNGFTIVRRLIGQSPDAVYEDGKDGTDSLTEHALFQAVCTPCPFFEGDCDFASWKRGESPGVTRRDVNPCGGLLFLACAVVSGSMDIQAVYGVI